MRGYGEAGRDHPGDPAVEDIGVTQKPPLVRREGVGTRAVVQGMGEGGGEGQRMMNHDI